MKTITSLATIIAVASAGQFYNHPQAIAGSLGYQQQSHGVYNTQPQTFTAQPHGFNAQSHGFAAHPHGFAVQSQRPILQSHDYTAQPQAYAAADLAYQGHQGQQLQAHQGTSGEKSARILRYEAEHNGHNYNYVYETENGIKAQEAGSTQGKGSQSQGGYSYTGDDGQVYTITYTADENGFRPQGAHIPTPPPIPDEIAKALEQNAHEEANGVFDDGKYTQQQHQPAPVQEQQQYQQPQYQQQQYQQPQYQQQQYQQPQYQQQHYDSSYQQNYHVTPTPVQFVHGHH